MVTTFLLTVLVDLTVALSVGMVLAAFLFMRRMAEVSSVQSISREMLDREDAAASPETVAKWRGLVPRGVEVYAINGPFFFGAAETFAQYLRQVSARPKAIILDLEGVPTMDSTGLRALDDARGAPPAGERAGFRRRTAGATAGADPPVTARGSGGTRLLIGLVGGSR